jgi:GNAT superfamily N-acetyltransferase
MVRCVKRVWIKHIDLERRIMAQFSVTFRPGVPDDAPALTDVFLRAMLAAVPGLPLAHTREEIVAWMRTKAITSTPVTVAMAGPAYAGFIRVEDDWIHQLFVAPEFQRLSIGAALIRPVLEAAKKPIKLWTFQRNAQARAFYEKQKFSAELFTDGHDNEERTPDVMYVWRPLHLGPKP